MKTKYAFFILALVAVFFASCGKECVDPSHPHENGGAGNTSTFTMEVPLDGYMRMWTDPGNISISYQEHLDSIPIIHTFQTIQGPQLGIFGYGQDGVDRQNAAHAIWVYCVNNYKNYHNGQAPPAYSFCVELSYSADGTYIYAATGSAGYMEFW